MELATVLLSVILGALAGFVSSYLGPRKLEEWRTAKHEAEWAKPRKVLLEQLLSDERWKFRKLSTLARVVGVTEEQCRDLLISIEARALANTSKSERWALISRAPLSEVENDNND